MMRIHPLKMILLMNALMLKPVVAMNSTNTARPADLPFSPFFEFMDDGIIGIDGQIYDIIRPIKVGAFGTVFEAIAVLSDGTTKKVAIKLITPEPEADTKRKNELFQKAEKEIKMLNDLKDSVNVVTIFKSEAKGSSVAIVMEYCTSDLYDWVLTWYPSHKFRVHPYTVLHDFVPFLSNAIQQMRAQQIVHFDIKTTNILRCGDVWKVADFDLAEYVIDGGRHVDSRGSRCFTDPDVKKRGGGIATPRTDLYSVGATLYTLVEGREYEGLRPRQQHFLESVSRHPWEGLEKLVQKLLKKEFKSLENFYDEAREISRGSTGP